MHVRCEGDDMCATRIVRGGGGGIAGFWNKVSCNGDMSVGVAPASIDRAEMYHDVQQALQAAATGARAHALQSGLPVRHRSTRVTCHSCAAAAAAASAAAPPPMATTSGPE